MSRPTRAALLVVVAVIGIAGASGGAAEEASTASLREVVADLEREHLPALSDGYRYNDVRARRAIALKLARHGGIGEYRDRYTRVFHEADAFLKDHGVEPRSAVASGEGFQAGLGEPIRREAGADAAPRVVGGEPLGDLAHLAPADDPEREVRGAAVVLRTGTWALVLDDGEGRSRICMGDVDGRFAAEACAPGPEFAAGTPVVPVAFDEGLYLFFRKTQADDVMTMARSGDRIERDGVWIYREVTTNLPVFTGAEPAGWDFDGVFCALTHEDTGVRAQLVNLWGPVDADHASCGPPEP